MQNDWITRIDQNTALFNDNFSGLSEEALNWKSSAETWSIRQIIRHVNMLKEDYFEVFSRLKSGELSIPLPVRNKVLANLMGKALTVAVEPERKKKMSTMKIWIPDSSDESTAILSQFNSNQEELKQYIIDLELYLNAGAIIHSPLSRWAVVPLQTAIEAIIQHDLRHFNQAKVILGKLENVTF